MLSLRRPLDPWQSQRNTKPLEPLYLLPTVITIGFLPIIDYPDKTSQMQRFTWVFAWRLAEREHTWWLIGTFRLEKDTIEDVVCRVPLARAHSHNFPFDSRAIFLSIQTYVDETKYVTMRVDSTGKDLSLPIDISSSLLLSDMDIFQK